MLTYRATTQFRRDYKKAKKQGRNINLAQQVIRMLLARQPLEQKYRDHPLVGNYKGCRECHIKPDWLLIYRIDDDNDRLVAERLGSHSELFD